MSRQIRKFLLTLMAITVVLCAVVLLVVLIPGQGSGAIGGNALPTAPPGDASTDTSPSDDNGTPSPQPSPTNANDTSPQPSPTAVIEPTPSPTPTPAPTPTLPDAETIAALDAFLAPFGEHLSVHFENFDTGFVYQHNAERVYFGASLSKAMYALYLFERAERGEIDLDRYLTFTHADRNTGSGIINDTYAVGTQFTVRELIRLNISVSDNVATLMLRRYFGTEGYARFIGGLGADPARVRERVMNSELTVADAGIFVRAIHDYIEAGRRYADELQAALMANEYPFIVSSYPLASKSGWCPARPRWHDMAIIYADSPFSLVIMTARQGWRDSDYRVFAEITERFEELNRSIHAD